jgi:hypothetical protein
VGYVPDGPAKYFWVLGRFRFETLRSACLGGSTRLSTAMQDIWVSPHSMLSRSMTSLLTTSTTTEDLFMQRAFQDLVGYPRILGIVDLRPL